MIETKRSLYRQLNAARRDAKPLAFGSPRATVTIPPISSLKRRLARPFVAFGISPNAVTGLGLVFLIGIAYAFSIQHFLLATGFIALNGFCDLIDGAVARQSNAETPLGKLFDRTADKISDAVILSLYPLFMQVPFPLGVYVVTTTLISTNISSNIEAVFHQPISDALSLRAARYALLIALTPFQQFFLLFILLSLLTTYSLIQRLLTAWRLSIR
ncbi:CDP-alcohol phosphatidyltransferase family protein [Candidatus Manganitrophus noduliformans]|uniref:CDP-alcohol phosphatidyltransferase family protein n=1 Tax=Candidatus Manganitrophus noduliformans TaxID=2606439 RepID=A0A7X6DUV5_9BACT|nr:CDP-alcohol phosphatidyltransferase family protein [Candidatus Manganitrophus noduliformans]NKE73755.1 CDP-alcohol phosphatidyltransferase family protein [Candidatus Manganitrophus noduliformans]